MSEAGFATLSRVRLRYRDNGNGPVLVLLHGWPQTGHEWRRVSPRLAGRFRLIVPDLSGFGDSSHPPGNIDIGTLAQDVIEFMDHLSVDRFSIVGHDWGGRVALAVALLARRRVTRLALVDTVLPRRGERGAACEETRNGSDEVSNLFDALTPGREAVYIARYYDEHGERGGALQPADLAEYARCCERPGAMLCGVELHRTVDVSAAFIEAHVGWEGELTMPVLSVAGRAGRGRGVEAELSILPLTDNLEAHVIEDCGRLVPEEAPDELTALLLRFLS